MDIHTPDTWAPNPKHEHVQLVSLKASDLEYKQVEETFNATTSTLTANVTAVSNTYFFRTRAICFFKSFTHHGWAERDHSSV